MCKSALGRFFYFFSYVGRHILTFIGITFASCLPIGGAGTQQQPLKDAYGAKNPRLSDGMQCTVGQIRLETRRRSYGIGLRFSCCKSVNCSILTSIRLGVWAVA